MLIDEIRKCTICQEHLTAGCRPILSFSKKSKILIIGQAPGRVVHESGVPWEDKSGDNLRGWMNVTKEEFYNPNLFGIVPMGFCYPGTGKSGDLPPRKECAPQWHTRVLGSVSDVRLTLLIGQYAQKYYLKSTMGKNLTETVKNYRAYLPKYIPLPHPSPRNNIWMKKNPWFKQDLLPKLSELVLEIIGG